MYKFKNTSLFSIFMTMSLRGILKDYDNIIWDWNGTLLNDVDICLEIVNDFLREHNKRTLTHDEYKEEFGFPIQDYYRSIGIDFRQESYESLTVRFISSYNERVKACQLHSYIPGTLQKLANSKKNQFILTAAHKRSVDQLLKRFDIRHFFSDMEGLDNHRGDSKRDKGLQLIGRHGFDKTRTLMIGDTYHDFEVADAMGISCILVANGHQSRAKLERKAPDSITILDQIELELHE